MIYLQPWWHSWLQNKKQNWGWLLQWPAVVVIGCCPPWDIILGVFGYTMCMRATIVYIYLCDCIGIFECEAHFNMIIVPASGWVCVCVVTRWWRALLVSQSGVAGRTGRGGGDRCWWLSRCFRVLRGSVQSEWSRAGLLFDDLRTVAPGFGLSLGERQPRRLCGHLRRVTGREALWHVLDSRWRWCGVCNLNWHNTSKDEN